MNIITFDNLNCFSDHVTHFTSTRPGGVSKGNYASLNLGIHTNDNTTSITKNRQLLTDKLGINTANLINTRQVHGIQVKLVDNNLLHAPAAEQKNALQGYDALITNMPGVCIAVTTADCVPVLIYDPERNAVAAVHSGWRSTLHNIVAQTIANMQQHYKTNPASLVAAIGPCISKENYEVGKEVVDNFASENFDTKQVFSPKTNGKYLFDIRQTVAMQLSQQHVSHVEISTHCTFADNDLFFSARRLGIDSGRMLSGIMIKNKN